MKRGESSIIAIIIILLIVIAIAGAAYSYIHAYWAGLTNKEIQLLGSYCSGNTATVIMRNIGTGVINSSDHREMLGLFHDDPAAVGAWRFDEEDGNASLDSSGKGNHGSIYGNTVLLMHFDEGSGNATNDETSYGNDGTLKNGTETCSNGYCPKWRTSGCKSGRCLEFDGDGDYVEVPDDASLNMGTGDFTVSLWMKSDSDTYGSVFCKGGIYNNGKRYYLSGVGFGRIKVEIDDNVTKRNIYSSIGLNDSIWHHVAGVRDGNNLRLYIDGSEDPNSPANISIIGNIDSPRSLYIGAAFDEEYTQDIADYFNGSIDEVSIYSQALTQEEITALYEAGRAKFIEHVPGRFGYAMEFDGWGDYVNCGDDSSLNFTTNNFSISAWFITKESGTLDTIVNKGTPRNQPGTGGYKIERNSNNRIYMRLSNSSSSNYMYSDMSITGGSWRHVMAVFVYNGTDWTESKLYVNGVENVDYAQMSPYPPFGYIKALTGSVHTTQYHNLMIGGDYNSPDGVDFNGTIDEVTILNRSLSQEEIQAQLMPACSCSNKTCSCGDMTIIKTAGEGEFYPYFDNETMQPGKSLKMTDYSCLSRGCSYMIILPTGKHEATAEC